MTAPNEFGKAALNSTPKEKVEIKALTIKEVMSSLDSTGRLR